ncbi:MAG: hypothetical protein ACOCRO_03755 [Halanaerobiales bacterium]
MKEYSIIEEIIKDKSKEDKYATYSDEEVVCSRGNTLFFKVSYPVALHPEIGIISSLYRYRPDYMEYTYRCLLCEKEQVQTFLSKKVYATIDLLMKYDVDKLNDYDYLEAIKELEEYLC